MTIALRCHLRRGPLSGWKRYTITTSSGHSCHGFVSQSRCYAHDWRPIDPDEPDAGEDLFGLVEVTLERVGSNSVLVGMQNDVDTVFYWVHRDQLALKPQESLDELLARRTTHQ